MIIREAINFCVYPNPGNCVQENVFLGIVCTRNWWKTPQTTSF